MIRFYTHILGNIEQSLNELVQIMSEWVGDLSDYFDEYFRTIAIQIVHVKLIPVWLEYDDI